MAAVSAMSMMEMDSKDLVKSALQQAYQSGRLSAFKALITFDTDSLNTAIETAGEES